MTGHRPEPRLLGIERFVPDDEPVLLDHLAHGLALPARQIDVAVPDHDRRGQIAVADDVVAELLERAIDVAGLAGRGVVDQRRLLLRDRLLEQREQALAALPEAAARLLELALRLFLAEADVARRPAVFDPEVIELVEDSRDGRPWEARDGAGGNVVPSQHRDIARRERL